MISNKSKLLFMQAKQVGLAFASVTVDDTEIFYDSVGDGSDVWVLDAEGNQQPAPDMPAIEIEGVVYEIRGSKMYEVVEEMEEVLPEPEEAAPEPAAEPDFQAQIDALVERVTALEALVAELCKPVEEPVVVEPFNSVKHKFDLSRFNIR